MNILQAYLEPGYHVHKMTIEEKQAQKIPVDDQVIWFDGKVNIYGAIEERHRPVYANEWQKIKQQGYFVEQKGGVQMGLCIQATLP